MRAEREFPALPDWLRARQGTAAPARLRRFGSEASDLEIAFSQASHPVLMARLLALCSCTADGKPVLEQTVIDMPVGQQMEALLALADMSDALPFSWGFQCAGSECRNENEFVLTAGELSALADRFRGQETVEVPVASHLLTVRRPTGRDQAEWLEAPQGIEAAAMLRRIVVSPPLEELEHDGLQLAEVEEAVDDAMDEFDPLPGFHMQVVCPECATISTTAPQLTAAALQRLAGAQEALLDEVHTIASRYHWSEAEILNMPGWRRQGYLERIEAGEYMP